VAAASNIYVIGYCLQCCKTVIHANISPGKPGKTLRIGVLSVESPENCVEMSL